MSIEAVFDTNVLLYAASKDPADAPRTAIALQLLGTVDFGVPLQVVQEFYHNARGKARLAIEPDQCDRIVNALLQRVTVVTDVPLFREACRISLRHQLSYWDSAILAAARKLGAPILYSEDLNDGQDYDGVKVINPFRSNGAKKLGRKKN